MKMFSLIVVVPMQGVLKDHKVHFPDVPFLLHAYVILTYLVYSAKHANANKYSIKHIAPYINIFIFYFTSLLSLKCLYSRPESCNSSSLSPSKPNNGPGRAPRTFLEVFWSRKDTYSKIQVSRIVRPRDRSGLTA